METAIPNKMDCRAMETVRLAIWTTSANLEKFSEVITASADSEAAVAPRAPIAMPTSAAANMGASLMPSPTMSVGSGMALTSVTLLAGVIRSEEHTSELQSRGHLV